MGAVIKCIYGTVGAIQNVRQSLKHSCEFLFFYYYFNFCASRCSNRWEINKSRFLSLHDINVRNNIRIVYTVEAHLRNNFTKHCVFTFSRAAADKLATKRAFLSF